MSDNNGLYGNLTDDQRARAAAFEITAKHTSPVAEHLTNKSIYVKAKDPIEGGLKAAFAQILEGKKPDGMVEDNSSTVSMFDSQTLRFAQWICDGTAPDDIDVEVENDDA